MKKKNDILYVRRRVNRRNTLKRFLRNRSAVAGVIILVIIVLAAIFAKQIAPYPYDEQNLNNILQTPSRDHLFGTDNFGRDLFTRVLYGARISLVVGFVSVGIGSIIGGIIGAISGYYGGKMDDIVMRVMDVLQAIPSMIMAISVAAMLGTGLKNAMIAIGVTLIPRFARVTRSSVLTVKGMEYVEAANALGAGDWRIILTHLIPNSLAPIIVQVTLSMALAILQAASLSFIGLGVQPPTPEWGSMLSSARGFITTTWHFALFPGLAIMLSVISINMIGDGLRDVLDPRLK